MSVGHTAKASQHLGAAPEKQGYREVCGSGKQVQVGLPIGRFASKWQSKLLEQQVEQQLMKRVAIVVLLSKRFQQGSDPGPVWRMQSPTQNTMSPRRKATQSAPTGDHIQMTTHLKAEAESMMRCCGTDR